MDWDGDDFRLVITVVLGGKHTNVKLPLLASRFQIHGRVRIVCQLTDRWPWLGNMWITFRETPHNDITIKPLKGVDLMDVPGISQWLKKTLSVSVFEQTMVLPHRIHIPMDEWYARWYNPELPPLVRHVWLLASWCCFSAATLLLRVCL